MRRTPDVLVIGGGVIGCAVAHAAAARGCSVLLVDRGALGAEASAAAAGVLAVASGDEPAGPGLAARRASLAMFPALAAALHEETGIDVEYQRTGVLDLCLGGSDDGAEASRRVAARRALGLGAEWLDRGALRDVVREASPDARGAILFPDDALVHPARLVEALAAAARRRGADLVAGAAVTGAERAGDRLSRVRVGTEWIDAGTVVLAAGAWAAHVPGVTPPDLGVTPARGQMLALRPAAAPSSHVLKHALGWVVPRRDGEVLVGATVEHVGFEKAVTPAGLRVLMGHLAAIAPRLQDAPLARTWCGLRPYAATGQPIVGRAPGTANLILACGHHRSGILLAPHTADAVGRLVAGTP